MTATLIENQLPGNEPAADAPRHDRRLLEGYLHKTSNTLCGIKGYASLIADRDPSQGEAGSWARKIIAEVERMEEIFHSVGDLTRGRGNPDTGVDLSCQVSDVTLGFRESHPSVNVRLESVPEGEIRIPAADLALMLTEILNNSAEAGTVEGPRVQISISGRVAADGRVFLVIEDNGEGMDPDLSQQAANPFVTTKDGHHGVGLTRIDTLMNMYGLDWRLESQEGRGTRVELEVAEVV